MKASYFCITQIFMSLFRVESYQHHVIKHLSHAEHCIMLSRTKEVYEVFGCAKGSILLRLISSLHTAQSTSGCQGTMLQGVLQGPMLTVTPSPSTLVISISTDRKGKRSGWNTAGNYYSWDLKKAYSISISPYEYYLLIFLEYIFPLSPWSKLPPSFTWLLQ